MDTHRNLRVHVYVFMQTTAIVLRTNKYIGFKGVGYQLEHEIHSLFYECDILVRLTEKLRNMVLTFLKIENVVYF